MTRTLPIWKVCKRGRASGNGRHTQGVSFLPKMVHERVRGRASGRGLPALMFFSASPPPPTFLMYGCRTGVKFRILYTFTNILIHIHLLYFQWRAKPSTFKVMSIFLIKFTWSSFFFSQFILAVGVASAFSLVARRVLWSTHALYSYRIDALLLETGSYSHWLR